MIDIFFSACTYIGTYFRRKKGRGPRRNGQTIDEVQYHVELRSYNKTIILPTVLDAAEQAPGRLRLHWRVPSSRFHWRRWERTAGAGGRRRPNTSSRGRHSWTASPPTHSSGTAGTMAELWSPVQITTRCSASCTPSQPKPNNRLPQAFNQLLLSRNAKSHFSIHWVRNYKYNIRSKVCTKLCTRPKLCFIFKNNDKTNDIN